MTVGRVSLSDDQFEITIRYDPVVVGAVKTIPGRRWEPERKLWLAPITSVRAVRHLATTYGLILDPDVDDLPDREPDTRPVIALARNSYRLRFDYDRDLIARVRDIPGARWSPTDRVWIVPTDATSEIAEFIVTTGARIDPTATASLTTASEALARIEASAAAVADVDIPNLGGELLPFQRAGVAYVLNATGGVLIGDQMGLGKTVQALATIAARDAYPALVVCPASLKLNWAREASTWLPGRSIEVLTGQRTADRRSADVTIVNYDVLDAWADVLADGLRAVVLDESHYIKNGTTIRTKAAIRLSDQLPPDALRLCLTGTPIVNAPGEIVTQLRFLQQIESFGGVGEFRRRYQSGHNLTELNRRLRATCLVRRRKDDVLTELPPKRWTTVLVDGDPAVMREYRKAEADVVSYLAEKALRAALESGATTDEAQQQAWQASIRAEAAEHLVAVSALKRLAAQAKIDSARQWVADFLDTGSKLVAFAHHRDVVETVATENNTDMVITGNTPIDRRQELVDRFQNDSDSALIVCSLKAAGVGLTLTAASDVLFIEQGWTPADMDQAADRCHRYGQTDSVTAWTMLTAGTIDEDIAGLIAGKRRVVDAATDGVESDRESGSVLGDLLVRLTARGLEQVRNPKGHKTSQECLAPG